jgi:hypothetical protein
LNAGVTSAAINFTGTWPAASGNYYVIVQVTSSEDVNPANNSGVSGSQTAVGLDEAPSGLHDSPLLTNAFDLGVTLQPGMTFSLAGTLLGTESNDIVAFNTGTAGSVTFSMVWTGNNDVQFQTMSAPSTSIAGTGIAGGSSLSWTWTVDAANAPRWLDIQNPLLANIGAYTLVIQAN